MVAFKTLVNETLWKVARNLIRDHNELELLQSGSSTDRFIERSVIKAKEVFSKELEALKFTSVQFADNYKSITQDGNHVVVFPIDGLLNFRRAIPSFASILVHIKRLEDQEYVNAAVLSFPAFGKIFFTEKGQGAWVERFEDSGRASGNRLRVSAVKNLADAVTTDNFLTKCSNIPTSRNFGCQAYDIASFAAGKLDAIYINSEDFIHKMVAELFAKEAGGLVNILENGDLIATNSFLASSLK